MKRFVFFFALACVMPMMAMNLLVEHRSGADLLQDVAKIGKWIYVGDNLQLLDKSGNVLATEPLANIKKITFSLSQAKRLHRRLWWQIRFWCIPIPRRIY